MHEVIMFTEHTMNQQKPQTFYTLENKIYPLYGIHSLEKNLFHESQDMTQYCASNRTPNRLLNK